MKCIITHLEIFPPEPMSVQCLEMKMKVCCETRKDVDTINKMAIHGEQFIARFVTRRIPKSTSRKAKGRVGK
jgi:hypothetical protein